VLEGAINPFKRQLLFRPRLILYLNRPEWEPNFRSPTYTVILGRSQDLFTYTSISVVELERSPVAYFEHTLAPYGAGWQTASGYTALMPRFLDYHRNRQPTFANYIVLGRRVTELLRFEGRGASPEFWIDPTAPKAGTLHLGLWFHTWVGDYDNKPRLA
jgi:CRISPR-associated protein Cas5t